jgi:hypothetical protein
MSDRVPYQRCYEDPSPNDPVAESRDEAILLLARTLYATLHPRIARYSR